MSGEGTSYAPKSPDLSSFYSAGPTPPAEQQPPAQSQQWPLLSQQSQQPRSHQFSPQTHSQTSTYFSDPLAPTPPQQQERHSLSHYQYQYQQLQQQREQHQSEPQKLQIVTPPQAIDQGYSSQSSQSQSHPQSQSQFQIFTQNPTYSSYFPRSQQQPLQSSYTAESPQSGLHIPPWQQYNASSSQPVQQSYNLSGYPTFHQGGQPAHQPEQLDAPLPSNDRSNKLKAMPPRRAAASAAQPPPPVVEPSPVKTKFPTARIKRIMQADEEVGKVAQQTPIAVGKALEMFMIALVTKSADVAREKNSKRVSAQMLKQVVESDEQWDFLREIVGKVEITEEKAGKGGPSKAKSQADSEDSDEEAVPEKKKRGAGRKKKV
ncbi:putative DNA polymerase epsilon subunit C [Podospora fimiseda]|uniref:NCT transcriptional regulatory complex subunit A n=1 Tax=Podospora fimiseda TaxID=252190 RepID=A0AAN7BYD5_9PEZI|nr:putative DNA polymerase epsilon subunit C [Podospora fimiseda]